MTAHRPPPSSTPRDDDDDGLDDEVSLTDLNLTPPTPTSTPPPPLPPRGGRESGSTMKKQFAKVSSGFNSSVRKGTSKLKQHAVKVVRTVGN